MTMKMNHIILTIIIGTAIGFILAETKSTFTQVSTEEVIVAQPPMQEISYLDYMNDWTQQLTLQMVEFETQTLELNQNPQLYANKEVMDQYSETIQNIQNLTTDLINYELEAGHDYFQTHKYFKDSATSYHQAMTSMWKVVTFYQLDVNYDIINQTFGRTINYLKNGMDLFHKGMTALH